MNAESVNFESNQKSLNSDDYRGLIDMLIVKSDRVTSTLPKAKLQ